MNIHAAHGRRACGAALLSVVTIVAVTALLAMVVAVLVARERRASEDACTALQRVWVEQAAQEHLRALLASAAEFPLATQCHAQHALRDSTGRVLGTYGWELDDESLKARVPAPSGTWYRSLAETAYAAASEAYTVYGRQRVTYDDDGKRRAPLPANMPGAAVYDVLARRLGDRTRAARLVLALRDATDADHAVSAAYGAHGHEGVTPREWFNGAARVVAPLGVADTNRWLHLGRLLRGWSGWNSDVHFYADSDRTDVTRDRIRLVLVKSYGIRTREYEHQTLLTAYAPGSVNEYGVAGMWRGAVIKATLAKNVCRADDEEWLYVEDNVLDEEGRMVFDCVPWCAGLFSTQFVALAAGEFCQYGMYGWVRPGDPIVAHSATRHAAPGALAMPHAEMGAAKGARAQYHADGVIIRGLDPQAAYVVTLLLDAPGTAHGRIEVLEDGAFAAVDAAAGRAVLFGGVPQQPRHASAAFAHEGYLPVIIRQPVSSPLRSVYGVELRAVPHAAHAADDAWWMTWDCAVTAPVDMREWTLAHLAPSGATQLLGRVAGTPAGQPAFVHGPARVRMACRVSGAERAPAMPDAGSTRELVLDSRLRIGALRLSAPVRGSDWQEIEIACADGVAPPGATGCYARLARTAGNDAASDDASAPFEIIAHGPATLTVRMPAAAAGVRTALERSAWLEVLDPAIVSTGTLVLRDQHGQAVAQAALHASRPPQEGAADDRARHSVWPAAAPLRVPNQPVRSPEELARVWRDPEAVRCAADVLHFNWQPVAREALRAGGVLRAAAGTGMLTSTGLNDRSVRWRDNEWRNWYLQLMPDSTNGDIYRVTGNCGVCFRFDTAGFPSGRAWQAGAPGTASAAAISYRLVTHAGDDVMHTHERGTGTIVIDTHAMPGARAQLAFRSASDRACRAVLTVYDAHGMPVGHSRTGQCARGRWVTPWLDGAVIGTQLVARFDILDEPDPAVRVYGFAWLPAREVEQAVNINHAAPDVLQARLGWPRAVCEAVAAHRPYRSFGDLARVPGMTDARWQAAYARILFRSDMWSAGIHTEVRGQQHASRVWLERTYDDGAVQANVRVRELLRTQ